MIDEKDADLMTERATSLLAVADEMDARRDALSLKLMPKSQVARALHVSGKLADAIVLYDELAATWTEAGFRGPAEHFMRLAESCRNPPKPARTGRSFVRRKVG